MEKIASSQETIQHAEMKAPVANFQASWVLAAMLGLSPSAFALDPFYPPAEWKAYLKRITQGREHEAEREPRPMPGASPLVALQTLIIPEFSVENTPLSQALSDFTRQCGKLGVPLSLYLDANLANLNTSITCSAKNETAQKVLSRLLGFSGASIRINGRDLLVGKYTTWRIDPYATVLKTWILSEELHLCLFPHASEQPNFVPSAWISADHALTKQGVPFPPGTYADYRPDVHALVMINRLETSSSFDEWIHEAESQFVIQRARGRGRIQMNGYELETKAFPLTKQQARAVRSRLVSNEKLAPFATSSQEVLRRYGVIRPEGSAVWLDQKNSELWILNTPEQLASCTKSLSAWLEDVFESSQKADL